MFNLAKSITNYNQLVYKNKYLVSKLVSKMEAMTFYEVLEIPSTANMAQIKKAYIKKAKEWHPDQNSDKPDAAEVFKVVTKAYETLKDPTKRQIYDLGSINPNFNQSATDEDFSKYYDEESNRQRRPYWQNKWYGFKKPTNEEDLRDRYQDFAKYQKEDQEWAWKSIILKLSIIGGVFVAFDILRYYKQQKHKELINLKKEILTSQFKDESKEIDNGLTLNDYIHIRLNQIEEEESGFEEAQ
ncbi:DnaJ domain protein (macronuclear) [Tetrahymena thermophila SB210]|uniref:DnaJ domain protein n=1 Tax=Tetrahymena thermophila (strain SB210) TaxID=312017 RepID=I7LZN4_TETTS|nr:DnaJ domain protein [Tetrahymena thermophila SB210]EAR84415.2 DnaJ domain protein [Tetrahymena thermophila SB210]|eukprot:XP_001032078.2 DnaJ domain protein [Tetrahymena thermophila SB210]